MSLVVLLPWAGNARWSAAEVMHELAGLPQRDARDQVATDPCQRKAYSHLYYRVFTL
jgi:hypothetical protein